MAWKITSEAPQLEGKNIVRTEEVTKKVAQAGYYSDDHPSSLLSRFILNTFNGSYGLLSDEVSEEQQWYVDSMKL